MTTSLSLSLLESGGVIYNTLKLPHTTLHLIEISRERALNALIPSTFHALHSILDVAKAPSHILLRGRGRAFSAGGDVRALRTKILSAGAVCSLARQHAAQDTLSTEYELIKRWARLRGSGVVTVGVCDGIAFGAGMGLYQACAVRLVSQKASFSMPEVQIGLIPDCGATFYYAKMPGCVGMYAALTAARIGAADAIALGLADGGVESGWFGDGVGSSEDGVLQVAKAHLQGATELGDASSAMRRGIDDAFSRGSVDEIDGVVAGLEEDWAVQANKVLNEASPTALRETFAAMKEAYAGGGLDEALERELKADSWLAAGHDFEEGVRARLVDKDHQPRWSEVKVMERATEEGES